MKKALLFLSLAVLWGLSIHAQTLPSGARIIGNDIGTSELSVKELRRALRGEVSLWPDSKKSVTVVFHAMSNVPMRSYAETGHYNNNLTVMPSVA